MVIRRIVANIATEDVPDVRDFYAELFGMETVMDFGWIATLAAEGAASIQVSVASEGGSGTPVPDISIEVDDVDAVYETARRRGCKIAYEITDEPWGVRRFYVIDPAGKVLNVLSHHASP